MEQIVLKEMQGHGMVLPADRVLIALSGGADSVCLFRVLLSLREKLDISLAAVHVNHALRDTADRDETFVAALCETYGIPLYIKRADVGSYAAERGLGTEEAARVLRYEAFEAAADECGATRVALAHHMDDQAETVLFHLCRGCSLEGLRGMQPVRDLYIRPLLGVRRIEVEAYLEAIGQDFMTDETNEDPRYVRNLLRGEVLPLLSSQVCDRTSEHIAQTAQDILQMESYIDSQADAAYRACVTTQGESLEIAIDALLAQHPYLQSVIVKRCLCEVRSSGKDITRTHVKDVLSLAKKQSGRRIDLPCGITAERAYEAILLTGKGTDDEPWEDCEICLLAEGEEAPREKKVTLPGGVLLTLRVFERPVNGNIPTKTYTKWFDYAKIKRSLVVRTTRQGDYFVFDDSHKKSVKDYLKDEKIPSSQRSRTQVVACEDHVLYVIGGRISGAYKVTDETQMILEISVSL